MKTILKYNQICADGDIHVSSDATFWIVWVCELSEGLSGVTLAPSIVNAQLSLQTDVIGSDGDYMKDLDLSDYEIEVDCESQADSFSFEVTAMNISEKEKKITIYFGGV